MCARIRKNIKTKGSYMSFDACESRILMHSVPLLSVGILGAVDLEMSYLIDFLLFRLLMNGRLLQLQLLQLFF